MWQKRQYKINKCLKVIGAFKSEIVQAFHTWNLELCRCLKHRGPWQCPSYWAEPLVLAIVGVPDLTTFYLRVLEHLLSNKVGLQWLVKLVFTFTCRVVVLCHQCLRQWCPPASQVSCNHPKRLQDDGAVHIRVLANFRTHYPVCLQVAMHNAPHDVELWAPQLVPLLRRSEISRCLKLCLIHPIDGNLHHLIEPVHRGLPGSILRKHLTSPCSGPVCFHLHCMCPMGCRSCLSLFNSCSLLYIHQIIHYGCLFIWDVPKNRLRFNWMRHIHKQPKQEFKHKCAPNIIDASNRTLPWVL